MILFLSPPISASLQGWRIQRQSVNHSFLIMYFFLAFHMHYFRNPYYLLISPALLCCAVLVKTHCQSELISERARVDLLKKRTKSLSLSWLLSGLLTTTTTEKCNLALQILPPLQRELSAITRAQKQGIFLFRTILEPRGQGMAATAAPSKGEGCLPSLSATAPFSCNQSLITTVTTSS